MEKLFVIIYDFFESRKGWLYGMLALVLVLCVAVIPRLELKEDISGFFGKENVLENFRLKDRIAVVVTGKNPEQMIEAADRFVEGTEELCDRGLIRPLLVGTDSETVSGTADFIYRYLPIFLEKKDYERMEKALLEDSIRKSVSRCYDWITSASGGFMSDFLLRDPLNMGTPVLKKLERFGLGLNYEIYDGYIFSKEKDVLLMYLEPEGNILDTGRNTELVRELERISSEASGDGVRVQCVGGPVVAVYNALQLKKDTVVTLCLALAILIPFVLVSFRKKRTAFLMLLPPLFGGLCALAVLAVTQGAVSIIAIGAGAVVLGIALSYSIHVLAQANHSTDRRQIVAEMAYPLTVGCLTTIGAFVALVFTQSPLLQDMGRFASLTLIGTTLFSLIFLPHFIPTGGHGENRTIMSWIEKANAFPYESKWWLVTAIVLITVISLFHFRDVRFDSDLMNLNYMPKEVAAAEEKLHVLTGNGVKPVYVISQNQEEYKLLEKEYHKLQSDGLIDGAVSAGDLIVSRDIQEKRIKQWNKFWNSHRENVITLLEKAGKDVGFRDGAFAAFTELLRKEYTPCTYSMDELDGCTVLSDWIVYDNGTPVPVSRMAVRPEWKDTVYTRISEIGDHTVVDRSFFSSQMIGQISEDFDYILMVSSLLVFLVLWVSYGRIELTLMTFLPLCVSWVIILGLMDGLNLEFNIVNIILATFIFGIGDDFSIFIMDGLMQEYRDGRKLLAAHKSAIFFSTVTSVVGMGVMAFAGHPALQSIALVSVVGLCVVLLVSYTILPFLFRLLISGPVDKGERPYTFLSLLKTAWVFSYFVAGCILLHVFCLILMLLPICRKRKRLLLHQALCGCVRLFLYSMFTVGFKTINPNGENFNRPAMVISNHQSFIDILLMLATTPKIILITNSWVWHSPVFGGIIRYAGFHHIGDGYEKLADELRPLVEDGYSVMIFPEGTRSPNCRIQRFHKGAFYLADVLDLDILPVVLYGPGHIMCKRQGFHMKKGNIVIEILPHVGSGTGLASGDYREQSRNFRAMYIREYQKLSQKYGGPTSLYFKEALIHNYIYKGPVLEWYMRVKCRLDGFYRFWNNLIPENSIVTDVGCGYGQLSCMLALQHPERRVTGIDYDADKVALAAHSLIGRSQNLHFIQGDMRTVILPKSDVFIFNDSLHYISREGQRKVLAHCVERILPGGCILVRDGDATNMERHSHIERTEFWSTRMMGFNRTDESLDFVTLDWMKAFAEEYSLDLKAERCDSKTSETLYIFKRKEEHGKV